jgi:hypothetical protein
MLLAAATLSAYAIFDKARAVWSAQAYPGMVDYVVRTDAADAHGKTQQRHYHEFWNGATNRVVVQPPVSDEQLANPYHPPGGFGFMGLSVDMGPKSSGVKGDLFDVPALAPNYSFGMALYAPPGSQTPGDVVAEIRREYHDPAPEKIAELEREYGLKTIAEIVTGRRDYAITLVGIEPIDGHQDYHLALAPLLKPLKYRLRDAWVNVADYTVDRLRIGANFDDASTERVSWLVNLHQWNGATYLSDETAESPLAGYHGAMFQKFSVLFEEYGTGRMPFGIGGSTGGGSLSEP